MDDKQLECFFKLAENCNYAQTARELYLTQSTVTRKIQSLESELGLKLFDRSNSSVKLTIAGARIVREIRPLYMQTVSVLSTIRNTPDEMGQLLKIGFHHLASVFCKYFLKKVAKYFCR